MVLLLCLLPMAAVGQSVGTVNFDFDSDRLDQSALEEIARIADNLKQTQSYKPTVVVGFTDAVGSSGYNDGLGLRRARQVAAALEAQGVPVNRIGTIASRGERELLVSVLGPERQNRRVTVSLGEIMKACRSYREVPITQASIGQSLQSDLQQRLSEAVAGYDRLGNAGTNTAALQMAGAAREDCGIATGYDGDSLRKVEYAQKCLCSSARYRTAVGG